MILNGKKLAKKIKNQLAHEIKKTGIRPGLASILVGDNKASKVYISIKEQAAKEVGIKFFKHRFAINDLRFKNRIEGQVLSLIKKLNNDKKVHGILVQLPLPKGFNTDKIVATINPEKDVDGFHPENLRLLREGRPRFVPPTLAGITGLIAQAENLKHKTKNLGENHYKAAILANSKTFAEPLKWLFEQNGIKTQIIYGQLPIASYKLPVIKNSDIVIVAKGKPRFLRASMIKKEAIVIDVGINKLRGKLVGDADFDEIAKKASVITPVPGGVGPMTVAMLLKNTFISAKRKSRKFGIS